MAKQKIKIVLNVKDWRQAMIFGMLMGIVFATGPQLITGLLLLGTILFILKLLSLGRI